MASDPFPFPEPLGVELDGMVRVSLLHDNSTGEIDRLLDTLDAL